LDKIEFVDLETPTELSTSGVFGFLVDSKWIRKSLGPDMVIKPHAEGLALSLGVSGISVEMVDEK
jgi:hypothetical protein